MLKIIFLIVVIIYAIQLIVFIIGLQKRFKKLTANNLPTVDIIVAARNEEKNILSCIKALNNLSYIEGKLNICLINDYSTDNTSQIIKEFIKDKPHFSLLENPPQISDLKGKANAIAYGIKNTSNEIIFTTDADCIVQENWVKSITGYYLEDTAMVCGFTSQKDDTVIGALQAADFIFLLGVASGIMNLGKPLSAIGNNMSYRRSVYNEIGGYEKIGFSITEDLRLLMAFHSMKKYKIIFPLDSDNLIISEPLQTVKQIFHQKKRWGVGGLESDIFGFAIMSIGYLANLLTLISFFFFSKTLLFLSFIKILLDYLFLKPLHQKLNLKLNFQKFIFFEIYYLLYVVILPIIVLPNKKVVWKERTYFS